MYKSCTYDKIYYRKQQNIMWPQVDSHPSWKCLYLFKLKSAAAVLS